MPENKDFNEEESKSLTVGSVGYGLFFGLYIYLVSDNILMSAVASALLGFLFFLLSSYSNTIKKILLMPRDAYKNTEGLQEKNLTALLKRRSVSDFLEYRAYTEEKGLGYYTMRDGRRGFAIRVHPGAFLGENVEAILTSCLEVVNVDGAVANFFTFSSRNVDKRIKEFEDLHLNTHINVLHPDVLHDMIRSRARHLKRWTNKSMLNGVDLRVRDFVNLISFSFPENTPKATLDSYYAQIRGAISELNPQNFTGQEMITMVKEILSPEIESWDSPEDYKIDMSTQMTSEGTRIRTSPDGEILIGDSWYAKTITTKNFPDTISLSEFTGLFYDKFGTSVQNTVVSPFMVSLTISYDNVEKTNKKLAKTAAWNIKETNKLDSTLKDSHPELQKRAEEARLVTRYQDAGQVPLRAMWSFVIFDNDKARLEESYGKAVSQFRKKGWSLVKESFGNIALLSMIGSLPLNFNENTKDILKRFRILFLSNNTQIAPLISDARGSKMMIPYIGRSGQLQGFDFYESDTNYNAVVGGESGSGKSYSQNDIHAMLLAGGYNIRGIDAGYSYKYLNQFIGGQYIEFRESSEICLNFFTKIILQRKLKTDENGDVMHDEHDEPIETDELAQHKDEKGVLRYIIHTDEYKTIVPIIGQMGGVNLAATTSENSNLVNDLGTKFMASVVERAVQEAYWQMGENAGMETVYRTLKDIVNELKAKNRQSDIEMLSRFIDTISAYCVPTGMFFKYFNGPNNINFKSSYVIAELDDLKNKGDLYNVVLMSFAQTVMAEFFGDRKTPKLFFVDEAMMVFGNPIVVAFLNDLYRRIRKYNGIAVTITQGIQDFFLNKMTEAMYNNANWKYFLQIGSDGIEQVAQSKKVFLSDFLVKLLKSIRNNKTLRIGEVLIRSEKMIMVSRLKTDPLSHYTYSGMSPQEKPYMDFIMDKYKVHIQDAVRIAALKVEHETDEDEAYKMLKGNEAQLLDDLAKKEKAEKCLAVLEDAITMDRVVVYKQKIQSLTNAYDMYENLMRVIKEDRSVLAPAVFLEHSRELGIYASLMKIIINKIFEHYENAKEEFSLNFSLNDIMDIELVDYLLEKIANSNASNRFIIELNTKEESNSDISVIQDFISRVKEYNVRIAFDDIGVKNISFDQMFRLDIDILKFESDLINTIENDKNSLMFVEMIIGFAKKLGITTMAIHVERDSTRELVKKLGIDYVQGFLIDKPSPLAKA
ncbi:MAG: EAL domain-containing protein [Sulfurimonas sp.]|jgi:conjugal transfer ATP-binding protein TraC